MPTRILTSPPLSGNMPEQAFDAVGACTWVEFDLDESRWAAAFGDGKVLTKRRMVVPFGVGSAAFVIAGGKGYVVDVKSHKLLYRTKVDYWATAIPVPGRDFIVAAEFTTIEVLGSERPLWTSDRIAVDGIILDSSTPDELVGKAWWEDGWYGFTLRYEGRTFQRGPRLATDWKAFADPSA